ncbi:MAG TPA: hypothetical protein VGQ26_24825, partial [Streptosporangiaceae bacterium]|nr:hypothetical protein [Streptosporangiaceae bacterium]
MTESSETWVQSASSSTRPASQGTSSATVRRSAASPGGAELGPASLGDDHAHLPHLAPVDQQQHVAAAEAPAGAVGVAGQPRQAKPQHVDRGGGADGLQAGQAADLREAAVGADGERRVELVPAVG